MLLFELASLVLTPLISVYAIATNLFVIYVIYHKENAKTTRDKHYIYMSLHCASNTLICSIQMLSLMSECQYPFGFFCSSIRHLVGVQYVKIVLVEGLNSTFRLLSNFTYLGFSLCRMSKIGKDHGNLIVFMSELNMTVYMIMSLLFSIGLSVCKALQFDVNLSRPEYEFPMPFIQNHVRYWIFNPNYVAITVVNAIYDMVNYFLFVLVHLVVDVTLIRKLRRVLNEKEIKIKEMKMQGLDKVVKENKESKRRVVSMVVFSSLFNFFTKVPSMITSLNDLRLLVARPATSKESFWFMFDAVYTNFSFLFFCSNEKSCLIFQKFGNCLFLISLCSTLHFLKHFDKNFQVACQQAAAFGKRKVKQNEK